MNSKQLFLMSFIFPMIGVNGGEYRLQEARVIPKGLGIEVAACCNKPNVPKDSKLDGIAIFYDGAPWKTVGEIRSWDLQKEPVNNRLDALRAHSDFVEQAKLYHGVMCIFKKTYSGWVKEETKVVFAMKTVDCDVCEEIEKVLNDKSK